MVYAQHGFIQRRRQRARHARTDEQRTRQSGPARERHHVYIRQRFAGLRQHLACERQGAANMVAARQFGHNPAEGLVHGNLRMQRVRQ